MRLAPGLPLGALMFVCPGVAAALLTYRRGGWTGVRHLLRAPRPAHPGSGAWLAVAALLAPAVVLASWLLLRLAARPMPAAELTPSFALAAVVVFAVTATLEEIGFTRYLLPRLLVRHTVPAASVGLGLLWAAWHVVPLLQAGRSAAWIAGWCVWTVAARLVMGLLYHASAGSLGVAVVFHASLNVAWQLFPVRGSHWDPMLSGALLGAAAGALLMAYRGALREGPAARGTVRDAD